MMPLLWNWIRKHFSLLLLLAATGCLALAIGKVVRGITWSLLMPISLSAALAGWGIAASRLNQKQAGVSLSVVGIAGVFLYIPGLIRPLWNLILSVLSLIPSIVQWMFEGGTVDVVPLLERWYSLSAHIGSVLARIYGWCVALLAGNSIVDPIAAALVWNLILWMASAWAGWQLHRNRRALVALTPGGLVLALVLDYTHRNTGLVISYLAIMLALMGLARNEWLQVRWQRYKVDYSDSIAFENLIMVGLVTVVLVFAAASVPSLSWQELVEKLRDKGRGNEDLVAESLGLDPPRNVASDSAYRVGGLPRQHLLSLPPEQMQDVALIISTGELPLIPEFVHDLEPNRYHWRAITYDLYSGAGWGSSAAQEFPLPANTVLLELPPKYRLLNQRIKATPDERNTVYWTGFLAEANVDIEIAWRRKPPALPSPAYGGDMLGALTQAQEYAVVSYVSEITVEELRKAGSDYPVEIARRYLQLPESTPERVLRLARELTQADLTPYDRAATIESYLRRLPYTLDVKPPPPGRDVVDYFLFTAKQGYCDYYATSMAVLARAVGLPARVVVGYASGEYNAPTAEYIIRQKDAHTWVEIYFSEIGWVEFEPTATQPSILRVGDNSASEPPPDVPAGFQALSWLEALWRGLANSLGGQALIAGITIIGLFFLWQLGETWLLLLLPSPKAISRMYMHLEKNSARLLPDLPVGHTPYQLQYALTNHLNGTKSRALCAVCSKAESEIERVILLYVMQFFSPRPPAKSQIMKAIRAWTRLRWRLWTAIGWRRFLSKKS